MKIINKLLKTIGIYNYGYEPTTEKKWCIVKESDSSNGDVTDYVRDTDDSTSYL